MSYIDCDQPVCILIDRVLIDLKNLIESYKTEIQNMRYTLNMCNHPNAAFNCWESIWLPELTYPPLIDEYQNKVDLLDPFYWFLLAYSMKKCINC